MAPISFPSLAELICSSDRNCFYFLCSPLPLAYVENAAELLKWGLPAPGPQEQVPGQVDGSLTLRLSLSSQNVLPEFPNDPMLHKKPESETFL